jgi:hypothetical protein
VKSDRWYLARPLGSSWLCGEIVGWIGSRPETIPVLTKQSQFFKLWS